MFYRGLISAGIVALFLGGAAAEPALDYGRDIQPILAHRCYACHGSRLQKHGLRLDQTAGLRSRLEDGPVVEPGEPERSLLIKRISSKDDDQRMPPPENGPPLSSDEQKAISLWIKQGAVIEKGADSPATPHWAFVPPVKSPVPSSQHIGQGQNPVDRFLEAKWATEGLSPGPPADRRTLARRLYLDVIGLPPSREELEAFVESTAPDAYEQLVDRLLASTQYGERWGRHWMDIWRYCDAHRPGDELRQSSPHIWQWRDWIVESLNADRSYARMVGEMLAGDEISPNSPDALRATGYLVRSWELYARNAWIDRAVEHSGRAFLGLSFNCARCHDHKFDPITQTDYFRLRACFEPMEIRVENLPYETLEARQSLVRIFDGHPELHTQVFNRGNEAEPIGPWLPPGFPAIFGFSPSPAPVALGGDAGHPGYRRLVEQAAWLEAQGRARTLKIGVQVADSDNKSAAESEYQAWLQLDARLSRLLEPKVLSGQPSAAAEELARAGGRAAPFLALLEAERDLETARWQQMAIDRADEPDVNNLRLSLREAERQASAKASEARAALYEGLTLPPPNKPALPSHSTGRRLALVRWIFDRRNPLPARVAVNHIWLRHFGTPLVEAVADFGSRSPRPRHAELLDYLAVELMEHGWSMKYLHRMLLTSRAYRLDSRPRAAWAATNVQRDPDNQFYWRANVRRMQAEVLRDSLLLTGSGLDLVQGGPELDETQGYAIPRRSLYFRLAQDKQMPFLACFDGPDVKECYSRGESVTPHQALALADNSFVWNQSRQLASRIWAGASKGTRPDEAFVENAFIEVLGRPPKDSELQVSLKFLQSQDGSLGKSAGLLPRPASATGAPPAQDASRLARDNLVHALFNHPDFISIR